VIGTESWNQVGSVDLDPDPERPEKREEISCFEKIWMDAYPWA